MVREAGFDDVFDSQATFRALLDSMSRPGKVYRIPLTRYHSPPNGFCPPALSILKTLCDHRVCFSIGEEQPRLDWIRSLEVNLAAPWQPVEKADYVLFDGASYDAGFARLNRGSLDFPESSATALLTVMRLSDGASEGDDEAGGQPARDLALAGPGVKGRARLCVTGLDASYAAERSRANRSYPLGVDLILVDPEGRVAGIPRTTTMEIA
jgi:alpha-D-ribose 1-methylphosphonate 5-triphosphate synthase subunit PhnH